MFDLKFKGSVFIQASNYSWSELCSILLESYSSAEWADLRLSADTSVALIVILDWLELNSFIGQNEVFYSLLCPDSSCEYLTCTHTVPVFSYMH